MLGRLTLRVPAWRLAAATIAVAALGSCDSATEPPDASKAAVYLRAPGDSLFLARSAQYLAVATGPDSAHVAWPAFAWTSSDTTVAVVDSTGVVLGVGVGTAVIRAEFDGERDSATVRVVMQRADGGVSFSAAAVGGSQHCALSTAGTAYCRQSADGDSVDKYVPLPGAGGVALVSLHASASSHKCGTTADGVLYCWGSNSSGQFLNGTRVPLSATSAPATGGGSRRFSSVSVSTTNNNGSTCGIDRSDGLVYCAGQNQFAQLGRTATSIGSPTDTVVKPMAVNVNAFTVLLAGTIGCAVTKVYEVYCWGGSSNFGGATPRLVSGGVLLSAISISTNHTCGLGTDGFTYCWGSNNNGQLGRGTITTSAQTVPAPVQIGERLVSIAAGGNHTCAISFYGSLYCWGNFPPTALSSRLGARRAIPVALAHGMAFTSVSTDGAHVCAVTQSGRIYCF